MMWATAFLKLVGQVWKFVAGWVMGSQRAKIRDLKATQEAKERAHEADTFDNVDAATDSLRKRQSKRRK